MGSRKRKPLEEGGYSIEARPSCWCRRKCDIWPYFQGGWTGFDINVTRIADQAAASQKMRWHLRFATGQSITDGEVEIPPLRKGEKHTIREVANDRVLGFTGDNVLTIPSEALDSTNEKKYETVYSFHVTPRVWVFLTVCTGFLAGVVAAFFGTLF